MGDPLREKLIRLVGEVIDDPVDGSKMTCVMRLLKVNLEQVTTAVLDYTLRMHELGNDFYSSPAARAALYLHSLVKTSYQQTRQDVVVMFLEQLALKEGKIAEIGFGVPSRYVTEHLMKRPGWEITLIDRDPGAIAFAEAVINCTTPQVLERVNLRMVDMDEMVYVGDFDVYLFLDSIEHTKDPTGYLLLTVNRSRPGSAFIFSLPICQNPTPMHYAQFLNPEESRTWLYECGLRIDSEVIVNPVPTTDFFAGRIEGGFRNLMVLCKKRQY